VRHSVGLELPNALSAGAAERFFPVFTSTLASSGWWNRGGAQRAAFVDVSQGRRAQPDVRLLGHGSRPPNPCVSDVVWMTSDRDVYSWQKRTGDEDC
jgi:hypothetical protein